MKKLMAVVCLLSATSVFAAEKCYLISADGTAFQREDSFCIDAYKDYTTLSMVGGSIGNTVRFATFKGNYAMDRSTGDVYYAPAANLAENSLYRDFGYTITASKDGVSKVMKGGKVLFYIRK